MSSISDVSHLDLRDNLDLRSVQPWCPHTGSYSLPGGTSTLVASYLARSRGSNEPELSISRVKDLDQFLIDCRAFRTDYGHALADNQNGLDKRVQELRHRFQGLLGGINRYASSVSSASFY